MSVYVSVAKENLFDVYYDLKNPCLDFQNAHIVFS